MNKDSIRIKALLPGADPDQLSSKAQRLHRLQTLFAVLLAGVILLSWSLRGLSDWMPQGWDMMKGSTALCLLMTVTCLYMLSHHPHLSRYSLVLSAALTALCLNALYGHAAQDNVTSDYLFLLQHEPGSYGRMSIQTALFFVFAGAYIAVVHINPRCKRVICDVLLSFMLMLGVVITAGYIYKVTTMIGQSADIRTAPHTLLGMWLVIGSMITGSDANSFHVFITNNGIGNRIARVTLPLSLFMPLAIITFTEMMYLQGWISAQETAAFLAAVMSLAIILLVAWIALYTNRVEAHLRKAMMVDELTQLYNYRGFHLLGSTLYELSVRQKKELCILYFDLDNLKETNDEHGHQAGDELIRRFAGHLRRTFRKSDVVARVGGDEFAVVSEDHTPDTAQKRLQEAVKYDQTELKIRFSSGQVLRSQQQDPASFEQMVAAADALMYEHKRCKRERQQSLALDDHDSENNQFADSNQPAADNRGSDNDRNHQRIARGLTDNHQG